MKLGGRSAAMAKEATFLMNDLRINSRKHKSAKINLKKSAS